MTSDPLNDLLRQWAEVFMHHSMRDFRQFTRLSGLSMSQLGTLFRLYHCGTCRVSDIGEHLGVTNAAASQMIDRLVQLDLLLRSENPNDRRNKSLVLTAKGRALVVESIEARRRWMQELTTTLSPDQQESITSALAVLIQAAQRLEER
jgi:DNA-binding MarR family transcriptional regulator